MEVVAKSCDDALTFIFSEQAVVDENTYELVAYRLVEERGNDGGIDTSAEAAYYGGVADLLFYSLYGFGDEVAHFPVSGAVANIVQEVF